MTEKVYSIHDLSEMTGLPRRTIHFYSQQGLLTPPHGAGAGAFYDENHLLRLQLIPLLRQKGLRLDEIRAYFNRVSQTELKQCLKEAPQADYQVKRPASPQIYHHFSLPAGITLTAPANLPPADQARLQQLLSLAQEIFARPVFQKGE